MRTLRPILCLLLCCLFPPVLYASPYYGASFAYSLVAKEPPYLHGFQGMLSFDPQCLQWRQFNIYFDGGISHFWITNTSYYTSLNIYSAAPVIRYLFKAQPFWQPFLELSIGVAYLNHTHLDDRNLGMHFAFQDRFGIGVLWGQKQQFSIGLQSVHYSNAHLSEHNSGITVPVEINLSYRFQG